MRIAGLALLIIIIARMIYDLTGNPFEALGNLLGFDTGIRSEIIKRTSIFLGSFVIFIAAWTILMPDIMAFAGQPFKEDTHVLVQMPMYGNDYIAMRESAISRTYRYMETGETFFKETRSGVPVDFVKSEQDVNSVVVTYQFPRNYSWMYYFMDYSTWPTKPKEAHYTFAIRYGE